MQLITFFLGKSYFGINILQVREINNLLRYTEVPDSSPFIRGLLNLRGQIITIFDLAGRLGRPVTEIREKTRNLIMKTDAETEYLREQGLLGPGHMIGTDALGFVVDAVSDVVEVEESNIQPPPPNISGIEAKFISGVAEMKSELLIILNIKSLVESCEE